MRILSRLLSYLLPERKTWRLVEDAAYETLAPFITPSVVTARGEHIAALLPYRAPLVRALVIEAKYHRSEKAFDLLGNVLAEYLAGFSEEEDAFEKREFRLIPVPLSLAHMKARGYNQAERITASALARLGMPGTPSAGLLSRTRDTESQTRLSGSARYENVRGAFASQPLDVSCTYVLIDDVVTTGATLSEAAAALRAAGAPRVICIALAH